MMGNPLNFLKGKYAEDEGFKNNIFKANSTNKVKEIIFLTKEFNFNPVLISKDKN